MATPFSPTCPRCEEKNKPGCKNCVCCGAALVLGVKSKAKEVKNGWSGGSSDPLVVKSEDLRTLLEPLAELNTWNWVADQCRTSFSRLKQSLFNQDCISFGTVDRWLTSMGLHHALKDGSLPVYANPHWTKQAFERYFLRCGDTPPDDVISSWGDQNGC